MRRERYLIDSRRRAITLDGLFEPHSPVTLLNAKPSPRNNPRRPLWGPTAYLLYNAVAAQ